MKTAETIICKKCKEEKSLKGFYKTSNGYYHKTCKPCFSRRQTNYYNTTFTYNLTNRLRTRALQAIKQLGLKSKGLSYEDIFGCSRDELISTMINKAEDAGLVDFEIDHIIPLTLAKNKKTLFALLSVDNLQVLSKEEHYVKNKAEGQLRRKMR